VYQPSGGPAISGLLYACGPLAIFRLIVAVIVNAFNGHACRTRSHVSIKRIKRRPSLANGDAAATIEWIVIIVLIETFLTNTFPGPVFFVWLRHWFTFTDLDFFHESTGRASDLSPGLAAALGLTTDDICSVTVPLP
jgi:hypothetical protein